MPLHGVCLHTIGRRATTMWEVVVVRCGGRGASAVLVSTRWDSHVVESHRRLYTCGRRGYGR